MAPESLRTFGGGTVAISVIWGGIERVFGLPHLLWLGLALSAVYGAVLLGSDLTDPDQKQSARLTRVMAAVVNVFIIFGAASSAVSGVNAATALPAATSRPALPHE